MQKYPTLSQKLTMLPKFARAELCVGGSTRAKFLQKIIILSAELCRWEIRPSKVSVFHLSVNDSVEEKFT